MNAAQRREKILQQLHGASAPISASGDKRVLTDDRIEEVAEAVMKAASRISHRMGYVE